MVVVDRMIVRSKLLAGLLSVFLLLLSGVARAQEPLFAFVQISDSQPMNAVDQQIFELVLDEIVAAGQAGALLPRPVSLVVFPGDLIHDAAAPSEWLSFMDTVDSRLTTNGIPYLAVPGNHDAPDGVTAFYEQYIGDAGVWSARSADFLGHNGVSGVTGWDGLRFIGFNNHNPARNRISSVDLAEIEARVASAVGAGENVFLVAHHEHDGAGQVPLASVLPTPEIIGYMRGHIDEPSALQGLAGNPDAWDLNTNSIFSDGAIIYYEVFDTAIDAYVMELDEEPSGLPAPVTISLRHPLTPAVLGVPAADLDASPSKGPSPLSVAFSDLSSGMPTSWLWEFGDGATSAEQHPTHLYTVPGTYDVTLTVSNGVGTDVVALTDLILVEDPLAVTTFEAVADAKVQSTKPQRNYGSGDTLRVKAGTSIHESHLQFEVQGLVGSSVTSAVLRLYVTDGSPVGGSLYEADSGWLESGITWENAPPSFGSPLAIAGAVTTGTWVELDVTAAVQVEGTFSFVLKDGSSTSAYYSSREGVNPPQLVITRGAPVAPGADFSATPLTGTAPLAVDFNDLSSGPPTSWLWDFGDGATSTEQHPSHVYASAGTFSVTLTVTNAEGSDSRTQLGYVVVDAPLPPTADFDASPSAGTAPLSVAFSDLSTGPPASWLWDFGDGATSSAQHPVHVYTTPGLYSVTLTASNAGGSDTFTRTDLIAVQAPLPTVTFEPVADARVKSTSLSNYGTSPALRVKDSSLVFDSYLQFDVQGLAGGAAHSALLRLYVTDGSSDGGSVHLVDDGWTETGINWANAPVISGAPLSSAGAVVTGTWVEFDVSAAVMAEGVVSFALTNDSGDSAYFSSREGANPPELVIEIDSALAPTADFVATPTSGTAPLTVDFSDLSSGPPESWLWDFGDGATSTEQHPSHVYAESGVYSVTLSVANAQGSDFLTRPGYVVVDAPLAPFADLDGSPTTGPAALSVAFTDFSLGPPTSWLWQFGDGATSTDQHPVHVYTTPGLYSVTLTATNAAGSDTFTVTDMVLVEESLPLATLEPVADARVRSSVPDGNYGKKAFLRVKQSDTSYRSYLQFDVQNLGGAGVLSATLRLFVTDASTDGGTLYEVDDAWTETGITWNNSPPLSGTPLGSFGSVGLGTWVEIDVSAAVTGEGVVSFGLTNASANSAYYSSREGTNPPQLVVETTSP
jgi:PKD repeat protein